MRLLPAIDVNFGETTPVRRSVRFASRFHFRRARATWVLLQPDAGGNPSHEGPCSARLPPLRRGLALFAMVVYERPWRFLSGYMARHSATN